MKILIVAGITLWTFVIVGELDYENDYFHDAKVFFFLFRNFGG